MVRYKQDIVLYGGNDMKKLLCLGLTATMLLSGAVVANAETSFKDVPSDHWAAPYIEEMAEAGFISGYEDKTFKPDKDISHLEGIVLFARAMGSNSEAMEEILGYATREYGDIVDEYDLAFGKDEVCYMLYRGALKADELDDFLASDVRNTPMKRYEAATVITKAMAAEKEANAEILVDLSYKDAKEIPATAVKFVYFVTENEIMTGMDGNIFSPNTNVKRSQIAVMLSRTVSEMGLSFFEGTIKEVDSANGVIITEDAEFEYTSNTIMYNEGKKSAASDMPENANAIMTVVRDNVCFVDTLYTENEEIVSGIFSDYFKTNDVLNITVKNPATEKNEVFECAEGIRVIRNGQTSSILDFKKGDYVNLTLKNGKVTVISAEQQTTYVQDATVAEILFEDNLAIKIEHPEDEYNGKVFNVSADVKVIRNDATKTMADILRGDRVILTLEYGQVTKVVATSSKKSYEGTIREIHITSKPSMVVEINGKDYTYDIPSSISIKVNGEPATIYDFKLGDVAKITIESQAITALSVTSSSDSAYSITAGIVTASDASFGAIKVTYESNGVTKEETIKCKDGSSVTATVIDANGKAVNLKDIKVGNIVTVRGAIKNGMFVASVILIESN